MLHISDIRDIPKAKEGLLDFCKKNESQIVLMPAGSHAQEVLSNFLNPFRIRCDFLCDNNKSLHKNKAEGIPILSFEEILNIKDTIKIIFATNLEIYEILKEQFTGQDIDMFYAAQQYGIYSINEICFPREAIAKRYDDYKKIYDLLEDDLSRKTLDNHLIFRCNYDYDFLLKEIQRPAKNQYFEDEIYRITSEDSIVDCGAYTGDTAEYVLDKTHGTTRNYYAFEPDSKNFSILKKKNYPIDVFNIGLFSEKKILFFDQKFNSSSKISSSGKIKVPVDTLDNLLKNRIVTFIKMDIEGAELEAMKGAEHIIKHHRPVLAICVYHKFNDIFDIPLLIKDFGVQYKYYLRHYSEYISETVLYAVPC